MNKIAIRKNKLNFFIIIFIIFIIALSAIISSKLSGNLISEYQNRQSIIISDRNGKNILVKQNSIGNYAEYTNDISPRFKELLLRKEDKYFYFHLGINPASNIRAFYNLLTGNKNVASSTITQQLAKILLRNETKRNWKNKAVEAIYAVSLEINLSKEEILEMYANSIYFGNKVQGIKDASRLYFDMSPNLLGDEQILQFLSTINNPSYNHPFTIKNAETSNDLANKLEVSTKEIKPFTENEIAEKWKRFRSYLKDESFFEIDNLGIDCERNCELSIDKDTSNDLRKILKRNLLAIKDKDATNGAIVVIRLPENELLSVIGSPDPKNANYGYQINMAAKSRPIGSTIKPFIYLEGFEKGLRPYTLVDDREYKYTIGTGFSFYTKNYDYQYRGVVNLHYALSNSLNVPSVKVLEYVGLENFYKFLIEDLKFHPVQNLENYQLGIALGELEMDLASLTYYFSIFPNEGKIIPLAIYKDKSGFNSELNADFSQNKIISDKKYIQLANKILSDRKTGTEQFGIKSELNLFQNNYAVKTGTSREYHDSWTIGYTPDFLIGVWVGNSDNTPMQEISGQTGAGTIWNEAMSLLLNSQYNKKTQFNFSSIKDFPENDNIEYGLNGDDYERQKNLLESDSLILNPHNGDLFLLEKDSQIVFKANENVKWYVNNELTGEGKEIIYEPKNLGKYEIIAKSFEGEKDEKIEIYLEQKEE